MKRKRVRVKTEPSVADDPPTTQVKRQRRAGRKAASGGAQETPKVSTKSRGRVAEDGPTDNAATLRPSVQAAPLSVEADTPLTYANVYRPPDYVLGSCSGVSLASMGIVCSGGIHWMEDEFDSMELSAFCWMKPVRTGSTSADTTNSFLS